MTVMRRDEERLLSRIWSHRDSEPMPAPEPPRVLMPVRETSPEQLAYLAAMDRADAVRKQHLYAPAVEPIPDYIEARIPLAPAPEYVASELVFDHFQSRQHPKLQPKYKAKTGPGLYVHKPCPAQRAVTKHQHRLSTERNNSVK